MANERKELNIKGANLWYFVGLIATDGCLSSDGRHIDITSKDYELLNKIKEAFGLINKICVKYNGRGQKSHHIQFSNRNLYDFLLSLGLTQKKSLILSEIKVPEQYFFDFFRGVIDGDGCIRQWIHPGNRKEQWSLRIYSGSENFLKWLENKIETILNVRGRIYKENVTKLILKYGKMAAREIVRTCYYENCLGLERKIKLAKECLHSCKGWNQSKTVGVLI